MAVPTMGLVKSPPAAHEAVDGLSRHRELLWTIAILLLAFAIRASAAWYWHEQTTASGRLFRLGDSDSYWVLAGHIARGESYEYGSPDASIFRAPLYPLALAPFTLITSPELAVWWARLFGCVCGTLAVWLIMRLAARLGGRAAALWSGGVAALYPGAIGMSIVILSEAIFCPLMLLVLLGWHRAMQLDRLSGTIGVGLLAGAASGLAVLTRPSWLLFMPFAGVLVLLFHCRRRRGQFVVLLCMALGCGLVMSPWWVRNARLTARFVPTTLQVGASLYDGLHEGASGASDENMQFVDRFIGEQREADANWLTEQTRGQATHPGQPGTSAHAALAGRSTFEYRLNARMQAAAIEWARKNVSVAFRLGLVKLARTWSLWPGAGEVGSTPIRAALTVGCFGVLICAAWASWRLRHSAGWLIGLCWLPAGYFTLLHMVFVGSIRYREPGVLVLTALAGCALSQLPWIQRRTRKSID